MRCSKWLVLLISASFNLTVQANENEELALTLKQLAQIESTLKRAHQTAQSNAAEQRFFFDYPQVHHDIQLMRSGIEQYLSPSRAQPRAAIPLVGEYRREAVR